MVQKFRVIIAGGRNFTDFRLLCKVCMYKLQNKTNVEIVSGTSRGADKLGEKFAKYMGYPVKQFPANWDEFGKAAGHIRNREMAKYGDALIAFWDGKSEGTKGMILEAKKNNLKVKIENYNKDKLNDDVFKMWTEITNK